jgi:hypothetical protein
MRPWQHACSSLGVSTATGAGWSNTLDVHEFLDISKLACADRRHRVVLHHVDLGRAVAQRAFPNQPDVEQLVVQHVREDLGGDITLAEWLERLDTGRLPRPVTRRVAEGGDGIAKLVCARVSAHPTARAAVQDVARFMFLPQEYYPSNPTAALSILMNTAGLAIVRRLFGPPRIEWYGDQRVVIDFGWIAEAVIMASYGRIPDLRDLVDCIANEPTPCDVSWNVAA